MVINAIGDAGKGLAAGERFEGFHGYFQATGADAAPPGRRDRA